MDDERVTVDMTRAQVMALDVLGPCTRTIQPTGWLGIMNTGLFSGRLVQVLAFDVVSLYPGYPGSTADRWCVLDMDTGELIVGINDVVYHP
jgi:hypothetical protein